MAWNGADLVDDFSTELGDTSSAFQTKVLRWINEGIREIASSYRWPFLREKGKEIFISGSNTQSIVMTPPSAATLAALAGGSLIDGTVYSVLITFYQGEAEVESLAGTPSATITPTGASLSITVSAIPVSSNTLVTARKVYLKKGSADYKLYSTIPDNTTTTTTITADTTSDVVPPDENYIHMIDGSLFLEEDRMLSAYSLQQLLLETNAVSSTGTIQAWAPVNQEEVFVYPKPSSNTTVSFYYFKLPAKVVNSSSSQPQIPSWLFEALHDYVIWRGYQYRDRAGQESKKINYDERIKLEISRKGKPVKGSGRVRSVTPDSDGFSV